MDIGVGQVEATFKDGCLSFRLATLMKQKAAQSPGPVYDIPPTTGKQVLSTAQSAPLIGFTRGGAKSVGRPIENLEGLGGPGPKVGRRGFLLHHRN